MLAATPRGSNSHSHVWGASKHPTRSAYVPSLPTFVLMARESHSPRRSWVRHTRLSGTQRVRIHTKRNSSLNPPSAAKRALREGRHSARDPIPGRVRLISQASRPIWVTSLTNMGPFAERAKLPTPFRIACRGSILKTHKRAARPIHFATSYPPTPFRVRAGVRY